MWKNKSLIWNLQFIYEILYVKWNHIIMKSSIHIWNCICEMKSSAHMWNFMCELKEITWNCEFIYEILHLKTNDIWNPQLSRKWNIIKYCEMK